MSVCGWREEKAEWKEMWLVRQVGPQHTGVHGNRKESGLYRKCKRRPHEGEPGGG